MTLSETLYVVLFIATFPALCLLSAFLDRVWPEVETKRRARTRTKEPLDPEIISFKQDADLKKDGRRGATP